MVDCDVSCSIRSFNLGPLMRVASGGELARFLLALKVVIADKGSAPTLIFDEIDTGVGGAVVVVVGGAVVVVVGGAVVLVVLDELPTRAEREPVVGHGLGGDGFRGGLGLGSDPRGWWLDDEAMLWQALDLEPANSRAVTALAGLLAIAPPARAQSIWLDRHGLPVAGAHVLDVGASTGGFTDCALQAGADRKSVV